MSSADGDFVFFPFAYLTFIRLFCDLQFIFLNVRGVLKATDRGRPQAAPIGPQSDTTNDSQGGTNTTENACHNGNPPHTGRSAHKYVFEVIAHLIGFDVFTDPAQPFVFLIFNLLRR